MENKADTFKCKGITFYAQEGRFYVLEPYGKDTEIDRDVYEGWKKQSLKEQALNAKKMDNINPSRDIVPKYSTTDVDSRLKRQEQEALEITKQILGHKESKGFKDVVAAKIANDLAFASHAKKLALEVALARHDGYIARLSFDGVVGMSPYFAEIFWAELFDMVGLEGVSAFLVITGVGTAINKTLFEAYGKENDKRKDK